MSHYDNQGPSVFGIAAEYDDPDQLLKAARSAWDAGYRDMDAYSPFPVHGLAEAIGFKRTWVQLTTLVAGLTGAAVGFGTQWYATVVHYPYDIGGRPLFSWPAYIPVTFECMVLFAAFTTGFAMLIMNGLPQPYHPMFNIDSFARASSDRFFLCIEATDGRFKLDDTKAFMEKLDPKPIEVSEVPA